jgi:hypothetical protein
MNQNLKLHLWLCIASLLLALACGSGGGSIASTSISGTGSGSGTSLSKVSGPIDQFGSIYVGGITFNTDGLSPNIEGRSGNLSELELGMWVTVQGNINTNDLTGTATGLIFETHQAGNISSLLTGNAFMLNNSTTLEVDQSTRYSTNLTLPLSVNDRIQASGQFLASGNFYATHVGQHRQPWDRHRLPAELQPQLDATGFNALQIEVGEKLSDNVWKSGNIVFDFQNSTEAIGGQTRVPKAGEKMSVRGQLLPSGNFQVLTWVSRDDRERQGNITGTIQSLSAMAKPPQVVIAGTTYTIEPYTVFKDESPTHQQRFGFRELQVGDSIELQLSKDGKVLELKKKGP